MLESLHSVCQESRFHPAGFGFKVIFAQLSAQPRALKVQIEWWPSKCLNPLLSSRSYTVSPDTYGANSEGGLRGTCLCHSLAENWALNSKIGRATKSTAPASGMGFRQNWQLCSTCHRRDSLISTRDNLFN